MIDLHSDEGHVAMKAMVLPVYGSCSVLMFTTAGFGRHRIYQIQNNINGQRGRRRAQKP